MVNFGFLSLSWLLLVTMTSSLKAEGTIELGKRHMVLVQADTEYLWGSYYFAVKNNGSLPQSLQAPLFLPQETVEFQAHEGLTDEDIHLDESGQMVFNKQFPPGLHLLSINFKVKVNPLSPVVMSFLPKVDLDEFSVATSQGSGIRLQSDSMVPGVPDMLKNGHFVGIKSSNQVLTHELIQVTVLGLPQGRTWFWVMGGIFFSVLVLLSIVLTVKTSADRRDEWQSITF